MCNGPWSAKLNQDSMELNQGLIPRSGLLSCAMTNGHEEYVQVRGRQELICDSILFDFYLQSLPSKLQTTVLERILL